MCRALPEVSEDVKWGNDLCFCVSGKMFAAVDLNPPHSLAFKCTPEEFGELVERPGLIPAPYMARNMWVQEERLGEALERRELEGLLKTWYGLVVARLPKRGGPAAPPDGARAHDAVADAKNPGGDGPRELFVVSRNQQRAVAANQPAHDVGQLEPPVLDRARPSAHPSARAADPPRARGQWPLAEPLRPTTRAAKPSSGARLPSRRSKSVARAARVRDGRPVHVYRRQADVVEHREVLEQAMELEHHPEPAAQPADGGQRGVSA